MTLNLMKLCVGCGSMEELAAWQRQRLQALKAAKPEARLMHVTRQTPRRLVLEAGCSLYWVIGGFIRARQPITGLEEIVGQDGIRRCGIALDAELRVTELSPKRPFQGWRYLPALEAPVDIGDALKPTHFGEIPFTMHAQLRELRLI